MNNYFQIVATCMQQPTKECASEVSTLLVFIIISASAGQPFHVNLLTLLILLNHLEYEGKLTMYEMQLTSYQTFES